MLELGTVDTVLRWVYTTIFVGLLYAAVNRLREFWRLRHFRGPRTTGISWWWHSRAVLSGESHRWYGFANDRYGPLVRVAPNHLITSSPELWAHINAVRSPYTRAEWYYHPARFEPGKDNVFTECNSEKHDSRRKKLASAYAGRENPALESSIDAIIRELICLISSKYASSKASTEVAKTMDLATKIQYLTLDVISAVGLGEAFGDLKADRDINDYLKATEDGLAIANTAFGLGFAWLRNVPIIGPLISPSEKDPSGYGRMMAEARKIVEMRKARSIQEKSDMISSFVRHGVSGDDLFQEVFEQILAGSDTTAAAIRIILLFVMSHPRVCIKLQAEIDEATKSGVAPAPPTVISDAEARRLPYLSAVIREGLRVHPPVVNLFSRIAPKGGEHVSVDGEKYFIPGGTMIGYSAWSMHRDNRSLYGDDTNVFRPERWLVDDSVPEETERLSQMLSANNLVFGHGRWACLGKTVAMMEIHKTVFELFRNFDLALTNPHEPWEISNMYGLFNIKNMWVNITKRSRV